ncbi:MAG TPA: hypothetical protein QF353_06675 [Gammaproteobacteria bacterium]|nr:hypothetical protein [Gammaproteobacteria bacterium]
MRSFFNSIILSSLLVATCPFILAASDQGVIDVKDMKLFDEFQYSVIYGKDLYSNYCRNQTSYYFQEVNHDMNELQYINAIECQISPENNIFIMGVSENDAALCAEGKCGVVTITMEMVPGSLYSEEEFFLFPLAGDGSFMMVSNTAGSKDVKGEGGLIFLDEDVYVSGWCIATGDSEDTYGVISLETPAIGDILLADVLGVNACTLQNNQ